MLAIARHLRLFVIQGGIVLILVLFLRSLPVRQHAASHGSGSELLLRERMNSSELPAVVG